MAAPKWQPARDFGDRTPRMKRLPERQPVDARAVRRGQGIAPTIAKMTRSGSIMRGGDKEDRAAAA